MIGFGIGPLSIKEGEGRSETIIAVAIVQLWRIGSCYAWEHWAGLTDGQGINGDCKGRSILVSE